VPLQIGLIFKGVSTSSLFTEVYKFRKKSRNFHCTFRIFSSFNDDVTDSNCITPNDRAKVNNELTGVWKETVLA